MTSIDTRRGGDLAVMLTGGGARAAYQVGLLRGIAKHFPDLRFQIITGVSAGAINAIFLAAHEGNLTEKTSALYDLWCSLECRHIFRFDVRSMLPFRSALASILPRKRWSGPRGVVDTSPLRELLTRILETRPGQPIHSIGRNIEKGWLHSVALMTLDYNTGQSVRWVQGRESADMYDGPNRRVVDTHLTLEHVLASAALPFVFPAVRIGHEWHGDGGIRLAAPLSPAVQLGASRVIAMSTGYQRSMDEASTPTVSGYPPTAQILNQLVNAIFLDVIDEDVARMERMNEMLRRLEPGERDGLRPIDLLVLRPQQDLGMLAADYEHYLPRSIKFATRALGAKQTESPDFVSLLMFEPHYTKRLIEIGEADIETQLDKVRAFFGNEESTESAAAAG
ncbi:MAG TPA: patatin-like phospholipase family protein [Thermoanaerobaculia bacterium]|nr:patatin-like phospholipase family protein [Thermoanaerobaculia bacterium]